MRRGRHSWLRAAALAAAPALAAGTASAADAGAVPEKAQACVACHGPDGNSSNPAVPSIAQQPAQFISMQLYQYREGNRKDAQMSPMAANLTNGDMNALAAYFAARKAAAPAGPADAATSAEARRITVQYNCVQCHGPALAGQQHIPRLAGQQREYLRTQLRGFVAGTRADIDGNMTAAVRGLSAADVDLLAGYLAGLSLP